VSQQAGLNSLLAQKDIAVKTLRRANERSSDGPFTIHYAATNGELDRLLVMLSRPAVAADIDARDPDTGWTPLHFAARGGHAELAKTLIQYKANVNAAGPGGETPLHLAAGWGTLDAAGLLLQEGADKEMVWTQPDPKDKSKSITRTAYDVAKQNLRPEISRFIDRWLPVGLSYTHMAGLSKLPPRPYSEEPDPRIASQLRALDMKMRVSGREAAGLIFTYERECASEARAAGIWERPCADPLLAGSARPRGA
jgi:hypothetical protein